MRRVSAGFALTGSPAETDGGTATPESSPAAMGGAKDVRVVMTVDGK